MNTGKQIFSRAGRFPREVRKKLRAVRRLGRMGLADALLWAQPFFARGYGWAKPRRKNLLAIGIGTLLVVSFAVLVMTNSPKGVLVIEAEQEDGVAVRSGSVATFAFRTRSAGRGAIGNFLYGVRGSIVAPDINVSARVVDMEERTLPVRVASTRWEGVSRGGYDTWSVALEPPRGIPPGRYQVALDFTDSEGSTQSFAQDFLWGVLALNTKKSVYLPGETVDFAFAVLDEAGRMVCDAGVELTIDGPELNDATLSTDAGTIVTNEDCNVKAVTDNPDYEAHWQLSADAKAGTYALVLRATTANGTYEIRDAFEVHNAVPFDIRREGPTRIFPLEAYTMRFLLTANEDFQGTITEAVPDNFFIVHQEAIQEVTEGMQFGEVVSRVAMAPGAQVSKDPPHLATFTGVRELTWEVDVAAGKTYTFAYTFDAADVSPEFWLLGPLDVGDVFSEIRFWQIASDDISGPLEPAASTDCVEVDYTSGTVSWTSPGGAYRSDNSFAIASGLDGTTSEYIECRNYGFSLPASSTIDGIVVGVERRSNRTTNGGSDDASVRLVDSTGTMQGADQQTNTAYTTTDAYEDHGGSTDDWSAGLDVDDINSANFGVRFAATKADSGGASHTVRVDHIRITVHYTPPTLIAIGGTTNISSGTVAVAVDSTKRAQNTTISGGSWTINNVVAPATGSTITVWVDGAGTADETAGVTNYSGSGNVAGMVLNQHTLTIGSDQNRTSQATDFGQYDNSTEPEILHEGGGTTLNVVVNSHGDEKLHLLAGDTLNADSTETVQTHDIEIDGTLDMDTNTPILSVSGSFDNDAAFLEGSGSTVVMTATTGTETIDVTGASDGDFFDLTLGQTSGSATFNISSAIQVNNDLSVDFGTLSGTQNVTVNGSVDGGGAVTLTGGTFTQRVSVDETFGSSSGANDWTFADLTMSNASGTNRTITPNAGTGDIVVTGSFLLGPTADSNQTRFDNETSNDRVLDIENVTIDVDGRLSASSTQAFTVSGDWTNDGILDEGTGTVTIDGSADASTLDSGCANADTCTNENFYDIEINKTAGTEPEDDVVLVNNGLRVSHTLTITDGELLQGALDVRAEGTGDAVVIAAGGEWRNVSTGNLRLDGDFNNAGTAIFNANGTACGEADSITITNISNTPDWEGAGTFVMVDVTMSNQNAAVAITVESSTNSGGNTGSWTFGGCAFDLQGYVLQENESSAIGNPPCNGTTQVVSVRVNGGSEQTTACAASNGVYSFSGLSPTAGDTLTIYLNGSSTPKANLILVVGAGDVIDGNLYRNTVIVRDNDDADMSILDMLDYDNDQDDTNMLFNADNAMTDTLVVDDGAELHVWTGDTFTPGGTVTTSPSASSTSNDGDLHVGSAATLDMESYALTIGGGVEASLGAFTKTAPQLTTFTATVTGHDVSLNPASCLDDVTFDGSGGGWVLLDALCIDGDLTMTAGTFSGSNDVLVRGAVVGTAGVLALSGDFSQEVSANQNFGPTTTNTDWSFGNLTFSRAAGTPTISVQTCSTCDVTVAQVMGIGLSGDGATTTLNAGDKTWTFSSTSQADPLQIDDTNGVLNAQTSTFVYAGDNDFGNVNVEDASYFNLTVGGPVVESYDAEAATTVSGDLTIAANATLIGTDGWTVNGSVSGAGTVTFTGGTFTQRVSAAETFGSSSGTNDWTFPFVIISNSDNTNHTVSLNGGSGDVIMLTGLLVGGLADSDVTILDNASADRVFDMADVTLSSTGQLNASSSAAFTVSGDWTNNGVFNEGTGTVTFDGTTSLALDSGCGNAATCTNENFYDIEINKTAGTDADDNVTLTNTHLRVTNMLLITDGELIQGAFNVQAEGIGASAYAVDIAGAGTWTNISTGDVALDDDLRNAGMLTFSANGLSCGDSDDVAITEVGSGNPSWLGVGTYLLQDVTMSNQNAAVAIPVYSSTDVSGNTGAWSFEACPTATPGHYLIRRNDNDSTTTVPDTGNNLDAAWDTEVASRGTSVTYSGGTFTLDAGIYLVMYSEHFTTTSTTDNERLGIHGQLVVGGSPVEEGHAHGFIRKQSGSQDAAVHGSAMIRIASNDTSLVTRFYRDDDSTTGQPNRVADTGGVIILTLDDANNFARYITTSGKNMPDTWGDITWDSNTEEDTGFSRSGAAVTISSAGRYVVSYSLPFSNSDANDRDPYQGRVALNGTEVEGSRSYAYKRSSDSTDGASLNWIGLIDVSASDVLRVQTDRYGTATTANTLSSGANLQIWRLPTESETVIVEATTGDYNAANTDFAFDSIAYIDTAAFTHTAGNTNIDVDVAGEYLAFATQANDSDAAARAVPAMQFRVQNTLQSYAINSAYNRGTQSANQSGLNNGILLPNLSAGDSVEVYNNRLGTVTTAITAAHSQFAMIRLDSIFPKYPTGLVESAELDTGITDGVAFNSFMWKGSLNGGSGQVRFQLATSDSDSGPWTYRGGSTCGSADWYSTSAPGAPVEITCNGAYHNGHRYFRYRVQICSASDCASGGILAPRVEEVVVSYSP